MPQSPVTTSLATAMTITKSQATSQPSVLWSAELRVVDCLVMHIKHYSSLEEHQKFEPVYIDRYLYVVVPELILSDGTRFVGPTHLGAPVLSQLPARCLALSHFAASTIRREDDNRCIYPRDRYEHIPITFTACSHRHPSRR